MTHRGASSKTTGVCRCLFHYLYTKTDVYMQVFQTQVNQLVLQLTPFTLPVDEPVIVFLFFFCKSESVIFWIRHSFFQSRLQKLMRSKTSQLFLISDDLHMLSADQAPDRLRPCGRHWQQPLFNIFNFSLSFKLSIDWTMLLDRDRWKDINKPAALTSTHDTASRLNKRVNRCV